MLSPSVLAQLPVDLQTVFQTSGLIGVVVFATVSVIWLVTKSLAARAESKNNRYDVITEMVNEQMKAISESRARWEERHDKLSDRLYEQGIRHQDEVTKMKDDLEQARADIRTLSSKLVQNSERYAESRTQWEDKRVAMQKQIDELQQQVHDLKRDLDAERTARLENEQQITKLEKRLEEKQQQLASANMEIDALTDKLQQAKANEEAQRNMARQLETELRTLRPFVPDDTGEMPAITDADIAAAEDTDNADGESPDADQSTDLAA